MVWVVYLFWCLRVLGCCRLFLGIVALWWCIVLVVMLWCFVWWYLVCLFVCLWFMVVSFGCCMVLLPDCCLIFWFWWVDFSVVELFIVSWFLFVFCLVRLRCLFDIMVVRVWCSTFDA